MRPGVVTSIFMNGAPACPRTSEAFLAWEEGLEGKHELDGPHIVPMAGSGSAHQRIDAIAIVHALPDATATTDHIADRHDDAALSSRPPDAALERGAIIASVLDCKSSGSRSADELSSASCVLSGPDAALPPAMAYRRPSFSA